MSTTPAPRGARTALAVRYVCAYVCACVCALGSLLAACGANDAAEPRNSSGADSFEIVDATDANVDYPFRIPVGAGEALDRGAPLEILPAQLDVRVGEVIEIVNEDDRGHLVGPFFVGARETLRQEFRTRGEFVGVCTVHPSGQIVVTVT